MKPDPAGEVLKALRLLAGRMGPEALLGLAERVAAETLAPGEGSGPPAPPQALARLTLQEPDLADLTRRYAAFGLPAAGSVWNEAYRAREIDLPRFRADNAYLWQARDGNTAARLALSAYCAARHDRLGLMDRLAEDGLFGAATLPCLDGRLVSRDLLDSVLELNFLAEALGPGDMADLNVLDIGAGYGRLAQRWAEGIAGPGRLFCADAVPESTFLCAFNLEFRGVSGRAGSLPLDVLERSLAGVRIGLAANVHSFSECPLGAVEWWLDLLDRLEVPRLFLVPNGEGTGGRTFLSVEPDGRRLPFLPALTARGWKPALQRPKYLDPAVQRLGISPTSHSLFVRA